MNRRGFMATSALLLPSWWLPKIAAPPKLLDLSPFCTEYFSGRYKMDRPFEQDDFVYATDGRIGIRARPQLCPARTEETEKLPPLNNLPWPDVQSAGWEPFSALVRVPDSRKDFGHAACPTCDGHGVLGWTALCDCEDGWVLNYAGDDMVQCPRKCNRHGAIGGTTCPECSGTAEVDYVYSFGEQRFAPRYIKRLSALPGLELQAGSPLKFPQPKWSGAPLYARFDGGSALLMGLYQ